MAKDTRLSFTIAGLAGAMRRGTAAAQRKKNPGAKNGTRKKRKGEEELKREQKRKQDEKERVEKEPTKRKRTHTCKKRGNFSENWKKENHF